MTPRITPTQKSLDLSICRALLSRVLFRRDCCVDIRMNRIMQWHARDSMQDLIKRWHLEPPCDECEREHFEHDKHEQIQDSRSPRRTRRRVTLPRAKDVRACHFYPLS